MSIPDFQSLMRPALAFISDGSLHRSRDVKTGLAEHLGLSSEDRAEVLPSGRQRTFDNRVSWALTYLVQAGLAQRPSRGVVSITDSGRDALAAHAERIDMKTLESYPSYIEFKERTRDKQPDVPGSGDAVQASSETPTDLIEHAVAMNRALVEGEILDAALALSPTGFEELVIRLLSAMGYGQAGAVERTSATGDAGVDGIISQDPLGLDRIYVQAKRYAVDQVIDRPKIHNFAGALLGKQGDRGVFITTSHFTSGAKQEAEKINARIELIDGSRLAQLLVRYGVGVQVEHEAVLVRLDEDFFEDMA